MNPISFILESFYNATDNSFCVRKQGRNKRLTLIFNINKLLTTLFVTVRCTSTSTNCMLSSIGHESVP